MDNFGKNVEIVKMQKVENITLKHKINGLVFFDAVFYMSLFTLSIFCFYEILNSAGVV